MIFQTLRKILISLFAILGVHYWGFAYMYLRLNFFPSVNNLLIAYREHLLALFAGGRKMRDTISSLQAGFKASFSLLFLVLLISTILGIYLGKLSAKEKPVDKNNWLHAVLKKRPNMLFVFFGNFFLTSSIYYILWRFSSFTLFHPGMYLGWNADFFILVLALLARPTIQIAQTSAELFSSEQGGDFSRNIFTGFISYPILSDKLVNAMISSTQILLLEMIFVESFLGWPGLGQLVIRSRFGNLNYSSSYSLETIASISLATFAAIFIFLDALKNFSKNYFSRKFKTIKTH